LAGNLSSHESDPVKSFFGVPAHPLLVHIPAVLLPLAAIGVVLMVIRPAWRDRYRWAVLAIGFIGTIGAILAADAGESLGAQIAAKEGAAAAAGWEEHAEAGETAQLFAIIFLILLALFILIPWYMERRAARVGNAEEATVHQVPKWVGLVLAALVLIGSAGTVVTVIIAGHSGAKAVWCETNEPANC
jgi:hypothetical protein